MSHATESISHQLASNMWSAGQICESLCVLVARQDNAVAKWNNVASNKQRNDAKRKESITKEDLKLKITVQYFADAVDAWESAQVAGCTCGVIKSNDK